MNNPNNLFQKFQKQGFWKKKSLGQNFLINPRIIDKIILTTKVTKDDTILEIGPGPGNLTKKLAERAKLVIAIEKDRRLIPILKNEFKDKSNIKIIEGDILENSFPEAWLLENGEYKAVGNIPYYITSSLLRVMFEKWPMPKLIVLMVQKEVAQRIIAKPPHMNLLALSVQYYAEPKIISYVSKNNFRPVPKVDSAIISLKPKDQRLKPEETEELFKIIKAGFSGKRKQLASNLSKQLKIPKEKMIEIFEKLNLKPIIRAENLSLEQWGELSTYLSK